MCKAQLICKPGNSRNIKKHLWTYCRRKDYIRKWMELYDTSQSNYKQKKKLTDSQLKLVLFFISTNTSLRQLENGILRELMQAALKNLILEKVVQRNSLNYVFLLGIQLYRSMIVLIINATLS